MTTQRPPRKDRQRNRDALLAAAQDLFRESGLGVPMDAIAKRAGVGNATIYRHFPDRTQLIAEVLMMNLASNDAALQRALAIPSGWDGFVNYMEWLFDEQINNHAYMAALRAVPAGVNDEVDRLRDKTFADTKELIFRSKRERRFRRDRWIEDVFLFLALNEQLANTGHGDPVPASRRFLDLLLSAVAVGAEESASDKEPPTVIALRRTLGSHLTGLDPSLAQGIVDC